MAFNLEQIINNNDNIEIHLSNESRYPNLLEYESVPENLKYFIYPIQNTNSKSFPEVETMSKINRNLTEEIGLFNIYKEINYDLSLQKEFSSSIYIYEPSIDQKEFYIDLIYLLQGIPSSTFNISNKYPFSFKLNEKSNTNNLRFIGTLHGMTNDILTVFIDFGTKMQLLQFLIKKYLFDINYSNRSKGNSPFFENLFRGVNEILIKINEKLIFYKKLLTEENFTMLTLYNKINSLTQIINVLFIIFNLNDSKNSKFKGNTLEEFFEYYNNGENNYFKKIHIFLDMLMKVYFTFYNKDKIFYIIKNILLSSLQSYLYYVIHLLFTGDSTDENGDYFILSSRNPNNSNNENNNISIDVKKLPQFLVDYKRILLNNTILSKYIKKFDENYYNMLTYNLKDFMEYINNINIRDLSVDTLHNFKAFKEEIYQRKLKLMEDVNKEVIYLQQLKENEINLRNIQKIKEIKNYFNEFEKEELKRKQKIKEKKTKYFNEINEQILGKKRKIEEEILKLKNEEIKQKEKEKKEKEIQDKFIRLMKLKYLEIQQRTKDIQTFGSLVNKWIFQREELNPKRKKCFEEIYLGSEQENIIDKYYSLENKNENNENDLLKKNYHITYYEKLEQIKNEANDIIEEPEVKKVEYKNTHHNSDNIKQIFNQLGQDKKEGEDKNEKKEKNEIDNKEKEDKNRSLELNDINLDLTNNNISNLDFAKSEIIVQKNEEEKEKKEKEKENKLKEEKPIVVDNKNKYLQNINLFPEREIPEDSENLYLLTTLIKTDEEDSNNKNQINNDIFISNKNKNKQIPIQLIIKEFFYDIIIKQNSVTNQTFILMLKNKFGLMHHFDFFNSIILCGKGNLILQYIESIFDFKTLTLNSSDPDFLTNELRSLIKADYGNNIKGLYLNSLLESLKFSRISNLNLNYAINNFEMNFQLSYIAAPPVDIIFNSSNSEAYDKIFKKLLKYNIYNQIAIKIFQILKSIKISTLKNKKKNKTYSDFNEDENEDLEESQPEKEEENTQKCLLIDLFNKSYKIFKGVLTYIYQQIIQKKWMEMEKNIEASTDVFQVIKYHHEALKSITSFFNNNKLIIKFDKLCNDLSQLYLQIMVSDYYDKQKEKDDFMEEIITKIKEDNKSILKYTNSINDMNPDYPLKNYL